MANSPKAKKRARLNPSRFEVKRIGGWRIQTRLGVVNETIDAGDQPPAGAALKVAQAKM